MPNPKIFNLLIDFMEEMQKRKGKYATLVVAYEIKVLKEMGYMPRLDSCINCGTKEGLHFLDVKDGGTLCSNCGSKKISSNNDTLIYEAGLGIINILSYFARNPLKNFQNLALDEKPMEKVRAIIDEYIQYHLDIGELKSQGFLTKE
jgi:DNA repair protein RecO (recombination protein O)